MLKPPTPYAVEKLGNAVYSLATSPEPLSDRLESALTYSVIYVKAKDVGEELGHDLKRILDKANALGPNGEIGSVAHTLQSMPVLDQQELAAWILNLYSSVERAYRERD